MITVTAARADESVSVTRYFKNKALDAVSFFTVVEPSALIFKKVENAQAYYITIVCGDEGHRHERFALGVLQFCELFDDGGGNLLCRHSRSRRLRALGFQAFRLSPRAGKNRADEFPVG